MQRFAEESGRRQHVRMRFRHRDSVGHLVARARRLLARALHARTIRHGVPIGQWSVLVVLWEEDGLAQNELARRAAIEPPTLARTLERMERDGVVERLRNRDDRRRVDVFLSQRGHALRDVLVPEAIEVGRLATAGLDDGERAQLRDLLERLIANLEGPSEPA